MSGLTNTNVFAQVFYIDRNQLSRAKSLRWTIKNSHHSSLCNSQQLLVRSMITRNQLQHGSWVMQLQPVQIIKKDAS